MHDIQSFTVESEYQNGAHAVRVLVPDTYQRTKSYRVLYVLPVSPKSEQPFGDPLALFRAMDVHNQHDLIIVGIHFEKEPWFGDHATDLKVRQASYLKEQVVPFVEQTYSTLRSSEGRLLFGFSKSGRGAFSLIFTYPDFFGYAASWDAPLMLTDFILAMKDVYGTKRQLAKYRPDLLIPRQKHHFQKRTRLVLTGEKGWGKSVPTAGGGSHTVEAHKLLKKEGIPHFYDNTLVVEHRWDERWMKPTLEALMGLVKEA